MTHEAFREKLLDLAYGELPGREAREVEAHAASCDACRAELARVRETRRAMSALVDEPAPARGESVLLAAARERSRGREAARRLPRWLFAGSIAAVAAVAVVAVSYRILEMRPGPLGTSDREALLGEARPAPEVAAAPNAAGEARKGEGPAPVLGGEDGAAAPEERFGVLGSPAPAAKAKSAPSQEPSRFAEPPPGYEPSQLARRAPPPTGVARAPGPDVGAPPEPRAGATAPQAPPPAAVAPQASRAAKAVPQPEAPGAAGSYGAPAPSAPADEARALADREQAPAPARSRSAPASAASAPSPPAAAGDARAVRTAPADAVRRYEALRAEGRLTGEIRTFPGCAAEAWRKVERDPEGRVVAWVREGTIGGARFRAEAIYGEDGRLARARALPLDGGPAPDAAALVPREAALAGIDAPPRCAR